MNLIHTIEIPVRLLSEANNFDHWTKKHKRKKHLQLLIRNSFKNLSICLPVEVKLIRQGKTSTGLDYANLVHSMKYAQDAIAEILIPTNFHYINKQSKKRVKMMGRTDNDPRITWSFDQRKGKHYALIIEIHKKDQE